MEILNPRYKGLTELEKIDYAMETYGLEHLPDEYVEVPCGRCVGCLKSQQFAFSMRLQFELASHPPNSSLFVTLTFDDENLSIFRDDLNKPVLRFLDLIRKKYGKQVRHWFVCEFGTLKGRPHYHGILFNCPPDLVNSFTDKVGYHRVISETWKYGITFTGFVTEATCKYVAKYVSKSLNGKNVRPRLISSVGLGLSYLKENAVLHKDANGNCSPLVVVGGKPMALPRYYFNKIFTQTDKQNMVLDRYLDPKYFWQGVEYSDKAERDQVRAQSFASHIRDELTSKNKFPSKPRKRVITKLLTENIKTEFEL